MTKISERRKSDIRTAIRNANFKKVLNILGKTKGFSKEKGILRESENKLRFMRYHKLRFKEDGQYSDHLDRIGSAFRSILEKLYK